MDKKSSWRVSLHGGHSAAFCDHAHSELRAMLDAAVNAGYRTFGVSEHAPRLGAHYLYQAEIEMGWTVEKLIRDFETYAGLITVLAAEYSEQIEILRAFEAEVVPPTDYATVMLEYRRRFAFDYMVGSVHWVDEALIDGPPDVFQHAVESHGGIENLAVRYYETLAEMVPTLRPEIVGHFDVIRKHAPSEESVSTPRIRLAAEKALEAVAETGSILDLNTSGLRKRLGRPYPAPWIIERARKMGIEFCFGDDSHSVADVGAGLDESRQYLLDHGVDAITALTRDAGQIVRRRILL